MRAVAAIDPLDDAQIPPEFRRELVQAVVHARCVGRMSAPTKGSGSTWVGRCDPAAGRPLGYGQGRFHVRSAGRALGALRAQCSCLGRHQKITAPAGAMVVHGGRTLRASSRCAHAAQSNTSRSAIRCWRTGCRPICRRMRCRRVRLDRGEAEDIVDLIEMEIDERQALVDSRGRDRERRAAPASGIPGQPSLSKVR